MRTEIWLFSTPCNVVILSAVGEDLVIGQLMMLFLGSAFTNYRSDPKLSHPEFWC